MMTQPLKILKNSFSYKIDEMIIDYAISYDITGKIYEARPVVFDLPVSAQQLIFKKNSEKTQTKVLAFGKLITLILPLAIVNQKTFFVEELKNIISSINEEIKNQGLTYNKISRLAEKESLEYYILSSHLNPIAYPESFKQIWSQTISVIENLEVRSKKPSLNIAQLYPQFRFKILTLVIPLLREGSQRSSGYAGLTSCKDDGCREYLLAELKKSQNDFHIISILSALSKQELVDPDIQDFVINLYRTKVNWQDRIHSQVMEVLQHFPNEKSIAIGVEILKTSEPYVAHIGRKLLTMGFPAKELAKIISPELGSPNSKRASIAFQILSESPVIQQYTYKTKDLLNIFATNAKSKVNYISSASMVAIIEHKIDDHNIAQIKDYLKSKNANVQSAFISMIDLAVKRTAKMSYFFTEPEFKILYVQFLDHEKDSVRNRAIGLLVGFDELAKKQDYLTLLLDRIDFENKPNNHNSSFMGGVNRILRYNYNAIIEPVYLAAIETGDDKLIYAALTGLKYSNDQALKQSLSHLQTHPSRIVQAKYKEFVEFVKQTLPQSQFELNLRKWEAEAKARGIPFDEKIDEERKKLDRKINNHASQYKLK